MSVLRWLRWLLVIPSPSLYMLGPKHWGPAERRYHRARLAGRVTEAFYGADAATAGLITANAAHGFAFSQELFKK